MKTRSLRGTLLKDLVISGAVVLAVGLGVTVWAANGAHQRELRAHYQGLTDMIGELVRPSVGISEYGETQRLLGLVAERQGIVPAVLTKNGDLLLTDYEQRTLFGRIPELTNLKRGCSELRTESIRNEQGRFDIHCADLIDRKAIGNLQAPLGVVITLHQAGVGFPLWLGGGLGAILLMSVVLMIWLLSRRIQTAVVRPIEALAREIDTRSEAPLANVEFTGPKGVAELERVATAFESLLQSFKGASQKAQELEKRAAIAAIAKKVSHNIRSPLEGVDATLQGAHELCESNRTLLRGGISRIRDIINELSLQANEIAQALNPIPAKKSASESIELHLISSLVESLISQKRIEYRARLGVEINLDIQGYNFFGRVQAGELRSALSNLVNNAVEAIELSGRIEVVVRRVGDEVVIEVKDNGKGISKNLLPRHGREGVTVGKP